MDLQASLTRAFGKIDPSDRLNNSLMRRALLSADLITMNLRLAPSTIELARAETELLTETGREHFLTACLQEMELPQRASVLLDCPASLAFWRSTA